MWIEYNPHPCKNRIGDCVIRALTKALNQTWEKTYIDLVIRGFIRFDLPNADVVWGKYLIEKGFCRYLIPDDGFGEYTVEDFAFDHPKGTYILGTGTHALTVIDGNHFDSWDSGQETPIYYFKKEG